MAPYSRTGIWVSILYFMLAITAATPAYASLGDINGSGVVEAGDAQALLDHLIGVTSLQGDPLLRADFNGDGKTDVADFVRIARRATATNPPAPLVNAPSSPTSLAQTTITGSTVPNASIRITGGSQVATTTANGAGAFSVPVNLVADRVNRLYVTATNEDGLESAASAVAVIRDSRPPELTIDEPTSNAQVHTESMDVVGRVADALSGFINLSVTVGGVAAQVNIGIGTNGSYLRGAVPLVLGDNTLSVTATDGAGNSVTKQVTVTRLALTGTRLTLVSGNNQSAPIYNPLAQPLSVRVTDANGVPVQDRLVTFKVTKSDGLLATTPGLTDPGERQLQVLTNANGDAVVFWRMGGDAGKGNNRLMVTAENVANTLFACASALPGPAKQINIGTGNSQRVETGGTTTEPLRAWVNDGCNGIAGKAVTFTVVQGQAYLNGDPTRKSTTVQTGPTGHAQVHATVGATGGNIVVEATFVGNPGAPAAFSILGMERDPTLSTTFEGVVLDNANRPLGGARCALVIDGQSPRIALTDNEGRFSYSGIPAGHGRFVASGVTATTLAGQPIAVGSFPSLSYDVVVIPNVVNGLGTPVLLPPLNPNNAKVYDGTKDVTLTVEGIEGLKMVIKAGSMRRQDGSIPSPSSPEVVSLNQVHFDEIPMPMPDGAAPPFSWTLQPGGATFDPPVQVTYPNMNGLPPGAVVNFLTYNHDTSRFEIVATGTVSEDGSIIASDPGSGITTAGWGAPCPPYVARGKARSPCENTVAVVFFCGGIDLVDLLYALNGKDFADGIYPMRDACRSVDPDHVYTYVVRAQSAGAAQLAIGSAWLEDLKRADEDCPDPKVLLVGHSAGGDTIQISGSIHADRRIALDPINRGLALQFLTGNCVTYQRGLSFPAPPNTLNLLADDIPSEFMAFCMTPSCNYLPGDLSGPGQVGGCLRGYRMTGADNRFRPGTDHATILQSGTPDAIAAVSALLGSKRAGGAKANPPGVFLNSTFTLSAGGQTYQADDTGFYRIENIAVPDDFGPGGTTSPRDGIGDEYIRISGVGQIDGETWYCYSAPFEVREGGTTIVDHLTFVKTPPPIPASIHAVPESPVIPGIGATTRMVVQATLPDGSVVDVSTRDQFTTYRSSNGRIARIDADGVVTGVREGTVFITATNFGATSVARVSVVSSGSLTAVVGRVETTGGAPVSGARVELVGLGGSATTNAGGAFDIPMVPTTLGALTAAAQRIGGGPALVGVSGALTPVPGGITDAGTIVARTLCEVVPGDCLDADEDGVRDSIEASLGFATNNPDTDGDGIPDGAEDPENDGLSVLVEEALGTNPGLADSDQDGIPDGVEILLGTSPTNPDTDGDGLLDGEDDDPLTPDTTPPSATLTSPAPGSTLVRGETITLGALATDNGRVVQVAFLADQVQVGTDGVAPFSVAYTLPNAGQTSVVFEAIATDTNGNTGSTGPQTFSVIPDPLTEVTGRVLDPLGVPAAGADVNILPGVDAVAQADGTFSVSNVPTILGPIRATATLSQDGRMLKGSSLPVPPVRSGLTDVGDIVVTNAPLFDGLKYSLVAAPTDVASGDLDEDGLPDYVVPVTFLNFQSGRPERLLVFFGNADGSFKSPMALTLQSYNAQCVLVADINGDGHLDIIAGKAPDFGTDPGIIGVFLGDGTGQFGNELSSATRNSNRVMHMALEDFDGDGKLDLVSAAGVTTQNSLEVTPGNGDGTFGTGTYYTAGSNVLRVAAADLDKDGAPDIIALNRNSGSAAIFFNNADGSGTFQPAEFMLQSPGGLNNPRGLVVADLNGDHNPDIAACFGDLLVAAGVATTLGNGNGTFQTPTVVRLTNSSNPVHLAIGDVNGDDVPDLVSSNDRFAEFSVLLGVGNGTFQNPVNYPAGLGPAATALTDVDADGDLDAVIVNNLSHDILVSRNLGAGLFTPAPPSYPTNGNVSVYLAAADVNNDGELDAIVANRNSGNLSLFLGNSDGTFGSAQMVAAGSTLVNHAFGYFNGDTNIDLAVSDETNNNVRILLGNGNGTFQPQTPLNLSQGNQIGFVIVGRFNVDAFDDIAVPNIIVESNIVYGKINVFMGNGNGTFQSPVTFNCTRYPDLLTIGDADGDGHIDLLVGAYDIPNPIIEVLYGDGVGGFSAPSRVLVNGSSLFVQDISVADVDDDGLPDIVSSVGYSDPRSSKEGWDGDFFGGVFIQYGLGSHTFTAPTYLPAGTDPADVHVTDIDDDGILDILCAGGSTRDLTAYLGLGGRSYMDPVRYNINEPAPTSNRGGRFVVCDANHDNRKDIIITFGALNKLQVLLQNP